jgi:hypothetical protein
VPGMGAQVCGHAPILTHHRIHRKEISTQIKKSFLSGASGASRFRR